MKLEALGVISLALLLAMILAVSACGEAPKDATVGGRDTGTADVINMPRGWSNIAHKCDGHGHRVYASDHSESYSSAISVIADPECGK